MLLFSKSDGLNIVFEYIEKQCALHLSKITEIFRLNLFGEGLAKGWDPAKGNLSEVAPGKSIGGDSWANKKDYLPKGDYLEADLGYRGCYRGKERMIYTKSGDRIYITNDHYVTFVQVK